MQRRPLSTLTLKFGPTPNCLECGVAACSACMAKIMTAIEKSRPISSYTKPKKGSTTTT